MATLVRVFRDASQEGQMAKLKTKTMADMTIKAKSDVCEHSGRERVGEVFEYRRFGKKL